MPQPKKITKHEAGYHVAGHFCGVCAFWRGGDNETGPCTKVKGDVGYDAGCELFAGNGESPSEWDGGRCSF